MKKKLMAGLLVFTMIVSSAMPVMAATRAKRIYIEGKKTVTVGGIIELDSEIGPRGAKVSDRNIIWTSSKPSVAKVLEKRDDDTKIKGMKAGTATITVRIKGTSIKKKCKITVKKASKKATADVNAAIKKINQYKADAKALKTQIANIQLASTYQQRRVQYHTYENKIDAIDEKIGRIEDKWEDKYDYGKVTYSQYRKVEKKAEAAEDYLETVEDYLEYKFNDEFD